MVDPGAFLRAQGAGPQDDTDRIFAKFDADRSGGIDVSELRRALGELGIDANHKQAANILRQYDDDQSGALEHAEFRRLVGKLQVTLHFESRRASPVPAARNHLLARQHRQARTRMRTRMRTHIHMDMDMDMRMNESHATYHGRFPFQPGSLLHLPLQSYKRPQDDGTQPAAGGSAGNAPRPAQSSSTTSSATRTSSNAQSDALARTVSQTQAASPASPPLPSHCPSTLRGGTSTSTAQAATLGRTQAAAAVEHASRPAHDGDMHGSSAVTITSGQSARPLTARQPAPTARSNSSVSSAADAHHARPSTASHPAPASAHHRPYGQQPDIGRLSTDDGTSLPPSPGVVRGAAGLGASRQTSPERLRLQPSHRTGAHSHLICLDPEAKFDGPQPPRPYAAHLRQRARLPRRWHLPSPFASCARDAAALRALSAITCTGWHAPV